METQELSVSRPDLDWVGARRHFEKVDPVMHGLAARFPDPPSSPMRPAFESLARAIVGQQLSVKAAATIWQRFLDHHGGIPSPRAVLETEAERHRSLGVSGQKHGYLNSLADRCLATPSVFEDVETMTDEEIIGVWTEVRGLGRWTVQMHLMFQLARPDVFPVDDLGIRRAMELHFGIPRDSRRPVYEKRALVWGPFRTAACRVLWMSLDNQPK